jgi:undecaprenyl-diphosphatase
MDLYIFQQINGLVGKSVCWDGVGIFFAGYLGYIVIGLVFLIFWKKWKIVSLSFLAAIFSRFGIVELIRFFWARPRPFIENNVNLLIEHQNTGSFPSGHAAFFFALSTVIFCYNKKAGILFFIASFLLSISRVFVGIHWPSDILAGAIVGIFSGWLICKILKKIK